jgi:hypothetical protein
MAMGLNMQYVNIVYHDNKIKCDANYRWTWTVMVADFSTREEG